MKIGKGKIKPIRLLRAASQILFFIFLPALYISTFSGIKEIYLSIYQHHLDPVSLLPQIVEAIAVITATLLLGRFFCGWLCSFGAMGEFISMLAHKIFKRRFRMNETADRLLKYVKYVWLVFLIVWYGALVPQPSAWQIHGMLSACF